MEIKLSRSNRIYRLDEPLDDKVIAKLNSGVSYQSIHFTIDGAVNLQVRGGSAGVIEFFYGVVKPIRIIGYLHKPLTETMEFIVESEKDNLLQKPVSPEMVIFSITPDTQRHQSLPELKSDLSKKRSKSDPKTPMPWTAMESWPLELLRSK